MRFHWEMKEAVKVKFHKVFDQEPNRRTSFENIATPMADRLEERMEAFMEDSDPDAALDVGAVMYRKRMITSDSTCNVFYETIAAMTSASSQARHNRRTFMKWAPWLQILVRETRSSPSSMGREDKLSSLHLPDSTVDMESGSTPQINKLKGLLQQRDSKISVLPVLVD
ncbi:hypothetical protein EOD39_0678 [Acipenser ruthenus]|uniref:Uncharacterized protein n=1 Tax=Acipenser ruthenus TaxID=7906 RepID=A0A444UQ92_ACIRT|nr:hypothetical protein EOD39_0678 [Acipenser ruthenus]